LREDLQSDVEKFSAILDDAMDTLVGEDSLSQRIDVIKRLDYCVQRIYS